MADARNIRSLSSQQRPTKADAASRSMRSTLPRIEQSMSAQDLYSMPQETAPARRRSSRFRIDESTLPAIGDERSGQAGRPSRAALLSVPSVFPSAAGERPVAQGEQPQISVSASSPASTPDPGQRVRATRQPARERALRDVRPDDGPSAQPAEEQELSPAPDEGESGELVSKSVGEIRRNERAERLRKSSQRYLMKVIGVIGAIVAVLAVWAVVYNSPAFRIHNVQVNGVEHLTSEEMSALANVPADTTLLRVDTDTIASRLKQSSWIEDVQINRIFPDTLAINVTERTVMAIVEMPNKAGTAIKRWAIADDYLWLMPIPDEGSEAAQTTSAKIYEDAENVVHIVDLPYGTEAEIGQTCVDPVVINALDILQGMTTGLADQVVKVSAASTAETSLYLDNGIEIAFGAAEDIRDKERIIQKIIEDNPDGVTYINVRMVENPTWRSI